jgi:hypothetical protein
MIDPSKYDTDIKLELLGGGFNKEERLQYFTLCAQLTSRDPGLNYKEIRSSLLSILIKEIKNSVSITYKEKEEEIYKTIDTIVGTIDTEETNHIGFINIISLQFILLFTLLCDKELKFEYDVNETKKPFTVFMSQDWKNYTVMKSILQTNDGGIFRRLISSRERKYKPYTTSEEGSIYLTVALSFLTLPEIINCFLDKTYFCGLSHKLELADGRNMNPTIFLDHDITHGENYEQDCFNDKEIDIVFLRKFNTYYNTVYKEDPSKLYSINFIVFVLIHESTCWFFQKEADLDYNEVFKQMKTSPQTDLDRFKDIHQLGLSIPKKYRGGKEDDYILESLKSFLETLQEFKKTTKGGKRKTRKVRRRNTKRVVRNCRLR